MNKQELVDRLISASLSSSHDKARARRAAYAKIPERALRREAQLRGLIAFDDPEQLDDGPPETMSAGDAFQELGTASCASFDAAENSTE